MVPPPTALQAQGPALSAGTTQGWENTLGHCPVCSEPGACPKPGLAPWRLCRSAGLKPNVLPMRGLGAGAKKPASEGVDGRLGGEGPQAGLSEGSQKEEALLLALWSWARQKASVGSCKWASGGPGGPGRSGRVHCQPPSQAPCFPYQKLLWALGCAPGLGAAGDAMATLQDSFGAHAREERSSQETLGSAEQPWYWAPRKGLGFRAVEGQVHRLGKNRAQGQGWETGW